VVESPLAKSFHFFGEGFPAGVKTWMLWFSPIQTPMAANNVEWGSGSQSVF